MPSTPISTPPSDGPMMRVELFPAELSASAFGKSSRGTSAGASACVAGCTTASSTPLSTAAMIKCQGSIQPRQLTKAMASANSAPRICAASRAFRRSIRSSSAPAGKESSKIGTPLANATWPTNDGLSVSVSASQPIAIFWNHWPNWVTTPAVQR
jgi:hypothetical protein